MDIFSIGKDTVFVLESGKNLSINILLEILQNEYLSSKFLDSVNIGENFYLDYTNEEILTAFDKLIKKFQLNGLNIDLGIYNQDLLDAVIKMKVDNVLSNSKLIEIIKNDMGNIANYVKFIPDYKLLQILSEIQNDAFNEDIYKSIINSLSLDRFILMFKNDVIYFPYFNHGIYISKKKSISLKQLFDILSDNNLSSKFFRTIKNGENYFDGYTTSEILDAMIMSFY